MTRQEAINHIRYGIIEGNYLLPKELGIEACKMAIKALEQQPCEDAISRAEALKYSHIEYDDDGEGHRVVYAEDIEELPPVIPQQKTGHWIGKKYTGFGEWKECIVPLRDGFVTDSCSCSECGDWLTGSDEYQCSGNFCPNCGAKMEVKADADNN